MVWISAPRWATVPPYLVVGWVALFVMPQLLHAGNIATLVLLAVGGVLYTVGAVVYASRGLTHGLPSSATTRCSIC